MEIIPSCLPIYSRPIKDRNAYVNCS